MDWNPSLPYNELPLLPPAVDVESREVLKLCLEARIALEHLKMVVENSLYKDVIAFVLPILECQYNFEIENIKVSWFDFYKCDKKLTKHYSALLETMRCAHALAIFRTEPFPTPITSDIPKLISSYVNGIWLEVRKGAGPAMAHAGTTTPIYTPPQGADLITRKLENWLDFVNESERSLDPLIAMAIAHYQFEAIRPFIDGNSRTVRILNHLFLIKNGILSGAYLCLCRYISLNRSQYYTTMLNVTRNGDWESWIKFMLVALREAASWTSQKAEEIDSYMATLVETMKGDKELEKIRSDFLLLLVGQFPFLRIKDIVYSGLVKRKTASKYLNLLERKRIFVKEPAPRGQVFVNREYMKILDFN
ncbi:MAG: Fic family protein [Burkholderiales bacterium]|nr:Fic family protein [Burkholderiales bacterium]